MFLNQLGKIELIMNEDESRCGFGGEFKHRAPPPTQRRLHRLVKSFRLSHDYRMITMAKVGIARSFHRGR
jgi:hypothetical protein